MRMGEELGSLERSWALAEADPSWHDLDDLIRLGTSPDPELRLLALSLMRKQIAAGASPGDYLGLAYSLVWDVDHNSCRWQALIVLSESIMTDPETVWRAVCEFGEWEDEDMRAGVATVLLEHLLEYHFQAYYPRLKKRIAGGSKLMADTLSRCYAFGQAKARWHEVEALLKRASQ